MPPLLVTGAPGWLCDPLLRRVAELGSIRCLVQASLPAERLAAWRTAHPEVQTVVSGDLADAVSLTKACEGLGGGAVIHAAGVIHPRRTNDWYRINRDGTLALARAAKAAGARRFVFVSSNAAQGAAARPEQILTEEMPCVPLSHYGKSKYEAEQGLLKLHEAGRFEVVIARPCMFYGAPVPERHVDIFQRIKNGRLPLVGGGGYARSISYIDDLVDGVARCLSIPEAAGEIFNLCDNRVYTTREICEAMAAALGVPARFIPFPAFGASIAYAGDCALAALGLYVRPLHLLGEANWNVGCSSAKSERILGVKTSVDVFEGYRRAVAWCREQQLL